jgi:hypothetical protein
MVIKKTEAHPAAKGALLLSVFGIKVALATKEASQTVPL